MRTAYCIVLAALAFTALGCERLTEPDPLEAPCRQLSTQLPTLADIAAATSREKTVEAQLAAIEKSIALTERSRGVMAATLAALPSAASPPKDRLAAGLRRGVEAADVGVALAKTVRDEMKTLAPLTKQDPKAAIERELKYMMAQCSRSVDKDCNRFREAFKKSEAAKKVGTPEGMMTLGQNLKKLRFEDEDMRRDVGKFAAAIIEAATALETATRIGAKMEQIQPKLDDNAGAFRESLSEVAAVCAPIVGE